MHTSNFKRTEENETDVVDRGRLKKNNELLGNIYVIFSFFSFSFFA